MCWTMCMTSSWSPSPSIGETSATRISASPRAKSAIRPQPGLWAEALARPRRQASR